MLIKETYKTLTPKEKYLFFYPFIFFGLAMLIISFIGKNFYIFCLGFHGIIDAFYVLNDKLAENIIHDYENLCGAQQDQLYIAIRLLEEKDKELKSTKKTTATKKKTVKKEKKNDAK